MSLTKEDLQNIEKLFVKKFDSIDEKFEEIYKKLNTQARRMDNFVEAVIERFDRVDEKIDMIDKKLFKMNTRINIQDNRLYRVEDNIGSIIKTISEYDLPNVEINELKDKSLIIKYKRRKKK